MKESKPLIESLKIPQLCRQRIRQIVQYQDADLIDEIEGETIQRVPTIGTYTIVFKGMAVECKNLHINGEDIYCVRTDDETIRLNLNLLDEPALKVIADKISNDITETEKWATNFFRE